MQLKGSLKKLKFSTPCNLCRARAVLQNDEIAIDFEINFNIHCSHKGEK